MKLQKLVSVSVLAAATMACSSHAQQQVQPIEPGKTERPAISSKQSPDFGSYRFIEDAEVIAPQQAGDRKVMGEIGTMRVVSKAISGNNIRRDLEVHNEGSVVRNVLTGEFGMLTGKVVVAADTAVVSQLEGRFGLTREKSYDDIGVFLLRAPADVDVLELVADIKRVDGVKEARVDVIDNSQKPM